MCFNTYRDSWVCSHKDPQGLEKTVADSEWSLQIVKDEQTDSDHFPGSPLVDMLLLYKGFSG